MTPGGVYSPKYEPAKQPETDVDETEGASPRPDRVEGQEGVRRPWWRRVFGS